MVCFDIIANIFCVLAIPIMGKRNIMLMGLAGVVVFCFGISANAYFYLNVDTSSFELQSQSEGVLAKDNPYAFPLFACCGVSASLSGCIPWIMNGEVYPFR